MTEKAFRFTKRLLMAISVALSVILVFVLEVGLKGMTDV
jgi:hypothetical protein